MAKSLDVADYIIFYANNLGHTVINLELSNYMYVCNKKFLEERNKLLIEDEDADFLSNGVVYNRVYREYSSFGNSEIKSA